MANELANLIRNVIARVSYIAGVSGNIAIVDDTDGSNALVVENVEHSRVHRGQMFSVDTVDLTLADAGVIDILMRVPAGKTAHLKSFIGIGGDARLEIFENPTTSADGSAQTVVNRNRASAITSNVLVFEGPTVGGTGTKIGDLIVPGAAVPPDGEFVLDENDYLFRLTNLSGAEKKANLRINFYENIIAQ